MRPSRMETDRGILAARSRSWVMITMVEPARLSSKKSSTISSVVLRVEVSGGLISQHDGRVAQQRPGDGYSLALAARELARPMAHSVAEPYPL